MFYATQQNTMLYHARYAAKHVKQWGLYMVCLYAKKRGVPAEVLIKAIRGAK